MSTPLLTTSEDGIISRTPSLRDATMFLHRASSRRMLREPSIRVRESAAEHIEEQQSLFRYSRPNVIADLIWNVVFIIVMITVSIVSRNENPVKPLRVWIFGYGCSCLVHLVCVCVEFEERFLSNSETNRSQDNSGITKLLESVNTMFSFIWWIVGVYWVFSGREDLSQNAPKLYWLCIAFLSFNVVVIAITVALSCVVGVAVCCCLPFIIAILNIISDQKGATKDDIERLPKYKFKKIDNYEVINGEIQKSDGGVIVECCVCLCKFDDGTEIRELPCGHHFHTSCIDKWLSTNASCPLCKFNIPQTGNQIRSDDV